MPWVTWLMAQCFHETAESPIMTWLAGLPPQRQRTVSYSVDRPLQRPRHRDQLRIQGVSLLRNSLAEFACDASPNRLAHARALDEDDPLQASFLTGSFFDRIFRCGTCWILTGSRSATVCRHAEHVDAVGQNSSCCKRSRMVQQTNLTRLGSPFALTECVTAVFSEGVEDF